jgi:hypothetical protein
LGAKLQDAAEAVAVTGDLIEQRQSIIGYKKKLHKRSFAIRITTTVTTKRHKLHDHNWSSCEMKRQHVQRESRGTDPSVGRKVRLLAE